jgi:predicted DNA-binding transcriptional regulator AlpA
VTGRYEEDNGMEQAQAVVAQEELQEPHEGGTVVPLFKGQEHSAAPLVTLGNGHWKKPDVARHLSVSERTVERWMQEAGLPHLKPFGKKGPVRFDPRKIQAWWDARCTNSRLSFGRGCRERHP